MIIYNNSSLHDYLTNLILDCYFEYEIDDSLVTKFKENSEIITPSKLMFSIREVLKEKYSLINQADLMRLGLKELTYNDFFDTCGYLVKNKIGKGLIGEAIIHFLLFECGYSITKDMEKDIHNKIDFTIEGDKDECNIQVKTIKSTIDSDSNKDKIDLEKSYQLPKALLQKIKEEKALNKYTHKYYHAIVHEKYFKNQGYYQRDVYIMLDNEFVHVYSFNNLVLSNVTSLVSDLIEDVLMLNSDKEVEGNSENDEEELKCSSCGNSILKFYLSDKDNNIFCSEKCAFSYYQLSMNSDGPENFVDKLNNENDFTF